MFTYSLHDLGRDVELVRISSLLDRIPGFLQIQEGVALMSFAATSTGVPSIVEIGSFKGKSTAFLAAGCLFSGYGHVYAVDHFCGSPEHQSGKHEETPEIVSLGTTLPAFKENMTKFGLGGLVTEIVGDSTSVAASWDKPIRMLFIDGEHSWDRTSADFYSWFPFVQDGGIICLHDYGNACYLDGVTKFIDDILMNMPEILLITRICSMMIFRKRSGD
jgi:hypothetical protein